jgi:hypothetical protein
VDRPWPSASSFALIVTLLAALPASAAIRLDRNLPIYPNGVVEGESGADAGKFKQALQFGAGLFEDTSDTAATVAAWYRAHLPASFTMQTGPRGTRFTNGGDVVAVTLYKGKTKIYILPK